jgi:hypothetical protein
MRKQIAAVDRLERAIEFMQSKIEELGGSLVVKMKVRPRRVLRSSADC